MSRDFRNQQTGQTISLSPVSHGRQSIIPKSLKHVVKRYGITTDDWLDMHNDQGGVCAICEEAPRSFLVIDHCHSTGRVRGLLCPTCNRDVATLDRGEEWIEAARRYLDAA